MKLKTASGICCDGRRTEDDNDVYEPNIETGRLSFVAEEEEKEAEGEEEDASSIVGRGSDKTDHRLTGRRGGTRTKFVTQVTVTGRLGL